MSKTKHAIYEAAIKVFSKSGYDGATMDDIALEAGVAKGTLYYHFKSKEEIFSYIISEGMKVLKEDLEAATSIESNPIGKLENLCRTQLQVVYENRDFFKVVMSQLWGTEIRHLQLRELIGDYIENIESHLKEAVAEGVIKTSDTALMSFTVFGAICSAAVYELINKDVNEVDKVIENLIHYILKGIQA